MIAHRAAIPARSRNRRCPARGTSRSRRRTCSKRAIPSTPPPSTLGPRVDHGLSRWQPHRANAGEQPIGGVHRGAFALEAFRLDRYRQVAVFPAGHGSRIRRSDCNFGPTVLHTRLATRITMPASCSGAARARSAACGHRARERNRGGHTAARAREGQPAAALPTREGESDSRARVARDAGDVPARKSPSRLGQFGTAQM